MSPDTVLVIGLKKKGCVKFSLSHLGDYKTRLHSLFEKCNKLQMSFWTVLFVQAMCYGTMEILRLIMIRKTLIV